MRLTELILILLISNLTFGQDKYVGIYNDRFSESIELKSDSTFVHNYRFDLSSSWTTGKWEVSNDTIYFKSELVSDSLQVRDLNGNKIKDSLVLSADLKINRIELNEFIMSSLSSGGQNRVKPPNKLYWKRNKLYRINENGTLDLRKVKAFWTDKKYKTYFRKETE
ncbi:hypothetical protein [Psychroserpens ponticola]|uniref:Uncharacterized protein n=1 Tax=Psychroserpens ponticola TaxID=2932268 RepID=A0ABY7S291_9FLAO|nr:hypothetical protein [Psychroserpens ponticola]WCO03505.1 hypothetical protein MUN68_008345 [Psychroserpens ponticola]WCO03521.1 hypothetical protein MUN68_008435 [Psychroserpens ponticola]